MNTKITLLICALIVLLTAHIANAQQTAKLSKIGVLDTMGGAEARDRLNALSQGLRELGYKEGENITIEHRMAEGNFNRLPGFADEMIRLKVDIIIGGSSPGTVAAKKATSTIPIIFVGSTDAVAAGLVPNLERPGGNVTGLTFGNPGDYGKRTEMLKETIPGLSRVGLLFNSVQSSVPLNELRKATTTLALQLQPLDVRSPNDFDSAFKAATEARTEGLVVANSLPMTNFVGKVVELAAKHRLPAIYADSMWIEAGGLMFYGVSVLGQWRRAANYVDKILKGAKPGDLPVEVPRKMDLVINLKAAQQIALAIPQSVLNRADKVIK